MLKYRYKNYYEVIYMGKELSKNIIEINKIMTNYEIENISSSNTIEELEDKVVSLFKEIKQGKYSANQNIKNYSNKIEDKVILLMPSIFYEYDNNYFALKNNKSFINDEWLLAIKCKRFMRHCNNPLFVQFCNQRQLKIDIYYKEFKDEFLWQEGLWTKEIYNLMENRTKLSEYGIGLNIDIDKTKTVNFIYNIKEEIKFHKILENFKENRNKGISTSELFFKPIIKKLKEENFKFLYPSTKRMANGINVYFKLSIDKKSAKIILNSCSYICILRIKKLYDINNPFFLSSFEPIQYGKASYYDYIYNNGEISEKNKYLFINYSNFDFICESKDIIDNIYKEVTSTKSIIKGKIIEDYFINNITYNDDFYAYVENEYNNILNKSFDDYKRTNKEFFEKNQDLINDYSIDHDNLVNKKKSIEKYLSDEEYMKNNNIIKICKEINNKNKELLKTGLFKFSTKKLLKAKINELESKRENEIIKLKNEKIKEQQIIDLDIENIDKKINKINDLISINKFEENEFLKLYNK